jgi:hypothetical protein
LAAVISTTDRAGASSRIGTAATGWPSSETETFGCRFSTTLYTGPVGSALHGVDLSWIVGLLVVSPVYYLGAKRFRSVHGTANRSAGLVAAGSVKDAG